jgi:hypothetical protein
MTAVALVVMFAFAALTIDGAELMTTRNQLQAAADAAALAGASGLIQGNQTTATDRIAIAGQNQAGTGHQASGKHHRPDVTFPAPRAVRVRTHAPAGTATLWSLTPHRESGEQQPTDVTAVAAAEVYDVCASDCLKPWSIPDRWDDVNANGKLDPGETYDPITTGYQAPGDVGVTAVLKMGNPAGTMAAGQYFPIDLPPMDCTCGIAPQTGGDQYRENIAECNPYVVAPGDRLQLEPGNKVGPTSQGVQALIDRIPARTGIRAPAASWGLRSARARASFSYRSSIRPVPRYPVATGFASPKSERFSSKVCRATAM